MTCIEKYLKDHPGRNASDVIEDNCPNISGGIDIPDPEYCDPYSSTECERCWNREVPCPSTEAVPGEYVMGEDAMNEKVKYFREMTTKMDDVYAAKNHDYGDSFSKLRQRYPISILIRLADKLNRLETLMLGADAKVKEESIDDTLLDLANYAVMELVERKMDKHDNK